MHALAWNGLESCAITGAPYDSAFSYYGVALAWYKGKLLKLQQEPLYFSCLYSGANVFPKTLPPTSNTINI